MAVEYTGQIIREAPEVEAQKAAVIQAAKEELEKKLSLPAYVAAGLSPTQRQAMDLAQQGIGLYEDYLDAASGAITQGQDLAMLGARDIYGINMDPQFQAAREAYQQGIISADQLDQYQQNIAAGQKYIQRGAGVVDRAAGMADDYFQADLARSQELVNQAALEAQQSKIDMSLANQAVGAGIQTAGGISEAALPAQQQAAGTINLGISGLLQGVQGYSPEAAEEFMSPYQKAVTRQAMQEMRRQADIARQQMAAQAVKAGAFGGTREGVQRAEFERNVQDQMQQKIMQDYAQNYAQAQQAAMQGFEQQQQRQLAQGTALGQLGLSQSEIGQRSAAALAQEAALQGTLGTQAGSLQSAEVQAELARAQQLAQAGQTLGQQQIQQTQLGQQGVQNMAAAGQALGQMGLQAGQLGTAQGNLAAQQAQMYGQMGQGIGSLAAQQAATTLGQGQALAQTGQQIASMGIQQGAIGQQAQAAAQADVGQLFNLGVAEQQNAQAQLDAIRATATQKAMQPRQDIAFLSDIVRGAPSTSMSMSTQASPNASVLQQVAGIGTGLLSAAGSAKSAGLI